MPRLQRFLEPFTRVKNRYDHRLPWASRSTMRQAMDEFYDNLNERELEVEEDGRIFIPSLSDMAEGLMLNLDELFDIPDSTSQAMMNATVLRTSWDPLSCPDWDSEKPSQHCLLRIKRDMMAIYNEPPPGMFVVPDEVDMTKVHALVTGPFDTPYEGGFFYFLIRCPPDYPIRPPRVKLMNTDGGKVRFNPNLYKSGKVCLSILGTWSGPAWSPAQSLSSVLISIQSLMNEKPYHNEPGYERERNAGDAARYNEIIQHETIRVAVCDTLEGLTGSSVPESLREPMETAFVEFYDYYEGAVKKHLNLDGMPMQDPFGEKRGSFEYKGLLMRLQALRTRLLVKFDGASRATTTTPGSWTSSDSD